MKILITGASSFTGAPLARALAMAGEDVRVLSRDGKPRRRLDGLPLTVCPGDIRDRDAVARAVRGCDSVIHLAYAPQDASPREIMDTAVNGMASVLLACELYGVRDLMLVSSPLAAGTGGYPDGFYGAGKLACEQMADAWCRSGVLRRALIARVFNVYGPDMGTAHVIPQFIARMADLDRLPAGEEADFPVRGSGGDVRSFIWTGDCTGQLMHLFRHGSPGVSRYDAGDHRLGSAMTMTGLAIAVGEAFGRQVRVMPQSPDRKPAARTPQPPPMLWPMCTTDFSDGLARTVAWYRDHQESYVG